MLQKYGKFTISKFVISLLVNLMCEFIMFVVANLRSLRNIMNSLDFLCNEIGTISLKT
jgi:hypothetical protein